MELNSEFVKFISNRIKSSSTNCLAAGVCGAAAVRHGTARHAWTLLSGEYGTYAAAHHTHRHSPRARAPPVHPVQHAATAGAHPGAWPIRKTNIFK